MVKDGRGPPGASVSARPAVPERVRKHQRSRSRGLGAGLGSLQDGEASKALPLDPGPVSHNAGADVDDETRSPLTAGSPRDSKDEEDCGSLIQNPSFDCGSAQNAETLTLHCPVLRTGGSQEKGWRGGRGRAVLGCPGSPSLRHEILSSEAPF